MEFELSQEPPRVESEPPASLSRTIVVKQLKKLKWILSSHPWSTAFLRYVRFTQLHSLQWSGYLIVERDKEPLISFFSKLPSTLQNLEFFDFREFYSRRMLKLILTNIPPISLLSFADCPYLPVLTGAMTIIGRLINAFPGSDTIHDQTAGNMEGPRVLASLDTIKVSGGYVDKMCSSAMIEMLEALHEMNRSQTPFKLIFSGILGENLFVAESRRRIKVLVDSGFDLEVWWDSERMDWSLANGAAEVADT
ncbi:hypothetical protein D9756_002696 [Leucocoprinus leucothites]|uniref:Uncharacterized protein n=1 Tax=Leucocoprinus leucothites TaxID=201217 RepID=A0A8H5GCA7_9AGAR|nr:hypothetical protein D9756_002696 [Leucoagaricus leucothites]